MMSKIAVAGLFAFLVVAESKVGYAKNEYSKTKDIPKSPIVVRITVEQKIVEQRLRILVSYVFTNTSKRSVHLEERFVYSSPGEPPPGLGVLDEGGYVVRFIGPFFSGRKWRREKIFTFRPGESHLVSEADITDCFNWPVEAQKMTIQYHVYSMLAKNAVIVESEPVVFDYKPVVSELRVPLNRYPPSKAHIPTNDKAVRANP